MIITCALIAATYMFLDSGENHLAAGFALLSLASAMDDAANKIIAAIKEKP